MFEAMITAASGIAGQQRRLDVIADNMANVNTASFKASRLNFKDMLYAAGDYPYADDAKNQQKGHGVMTASISRAFSTGSFSPSGRELDFAIEGPGFFQLMAADGSFYYSRAGNFYTSNIGGDQYLVNGSGHFVLDDGGAPIVQPAWAQQASVDTNGQITFIGNGNRNEAGPQIAVCDFVNPDGLSSLGGCKYTPTEASGEAQGGQKYQLRQGVIENSNVDIAEEMTRMIRAQRAFSFASRALTTADQMEGVANNMRR